MVKAAGVALWLVFAPAGVALLPVHYSWKGALPLAGVEGRVLADTLVHLLNPPGAAILTVLMMALALYLTSTFTMASAPQWFSGHFAFLRSGREQVASWREADAKQTAVAAAAAAADEPISAEETVPAATQSNSLLSGLLRLFSRRKAAPSASADAADPMPTEQASLWEGMPRTNVDAPELSGLAAASAAAAPYAAQLAAAAAPLHGETEYERPFDSAEAAASAPRIRLASGEDDNWLDAPERQSFAPILNKAAQAAAEAAGAAAPTGEARLDPAHPRTQPVPDAVAVPGPRAHAGAARSASRAEPTHARAHRPPDRPATDAGDAVTYG